MNKAQELALKYARKFKPTLFDSGIGSRLPTEYRKFYDEWRNTTPQPVHYIPKGGKLWERDEATGLVKRNEDIPLPLTCTKELHKVFTGGELIVQGFRKKKPKGIRVPRFWVPVTYKSVIYSEILNKYMSVMMTKRATELILKHRGLDNYLLQTKACDLQTLVAVALKRKLMISLRDRDLPYDEEKNKTIIEKYEKYLPPAEEIEWYGLSFTQACNKLKAIEKEEAKAKIIPLKIVYRAELLKELESVDKSEDKSKDKEEKISQEKSSWFSKIPNFNKLLKKD